MADPEPWLRGTHVGTASVARAVLHALELANEDLRKWCGEMTDEAINARPAGIAPVAFHLRHISRSIDRLLTYAEGRQLSSEQTALLKSELDGGAKREELFAELETSLTGAANRVRALANANLEEERFVGKGRLPTSLGGLLVHAADHTQRHVGQAITTARIAGR